ncbi:hypothetical protein ACFX2J_000344 [Malus domestica]
MGQVGILMLVLLWSKSPKLRWKPKRSVFLNSLVSSRPTYRVRGISLALPTKRACDAFSLSKQKSKSCSNHGHNFESIKFICDSSIGDLRDVTISPSREFNKVEKAGWLRSSKSNFKRNIQVVAVENP